MIDVTNYDGRLESMAKYCKAMYQNIAKVENAYYDATDSNYKMSLPGKFFDLLGIKKIGGKTIVLNQLVNTGDTSVDTISGHKYFTYISGTASVITSDGSAVSIVDDTEDMVIDMTLLFGSGNEPATAADFEAILPSLYEYDPGSLLSAGVTEIVSKDSNDTTIATYSIPSAVQALDSYGASTRTKNNYVDFDRKVYVQNVKYVDLGSIDWSYNENYGGYGAFYSTDFNFSYVADSNAPDLICGKYPTVSRDTLYGSSDDAICFTGSSNTRYLTVRDTDYTDTATFKSAMSGIYACGILHTPIETDISDYLTDIDIDAEAGGTLTFENQHGDDYRIPVPVELEYIGV